MNHPCHRLAVPGLLAALLAWDGRAQAGPPPLAAVTTSNRPHLDAAVSPDGTQVAFRVGSQALGVVSIGSQIEAILHTSAGNNLEDFLWDPSSATLYFLEGNTIRRIARTGGAPVVLANVSGANVDLWAIDSQGSNLYGTRFDNATGLTHVFRLATNGQSPPQDILSQQAVLDELRIDPTDSFLLYRSWNGSPFTPVTYTRAPISGTPQTPLYTSGINDNPMSAYWLDAGQTFCLSMISPTVANWHIGRVDASGNLQLLTDLNGFHRRTVVGRQQRWILAEVFSPDGSGITLGLIPPLGGGVVILDRGQPLFGNGGVMSGGLSIDDAGSVVAFSASSSPSDPNAQVYVTRVQDEVRVFPRLQTGQTFVMEIGAATGEIGAIAVSLGLNGMGPITVPGIGGSFALDPSAMATAVVGVGNGTGPISGSSLVPNDPLFVGFRLFFQGLRLGPAGGAFTRWGYMQVF